MYSLTDLASLSVEQLEKGIIEAIVYAGGEEIMGRMPWVPVVGKTYDYNYEASLPNTQFASVNEELTESTGTVTEVSIALKQLFAQSDVDKFERDTYVTAGNLEAITLEKLAKAWTNKFMDTFFYGDATADTKTFSGLHKLMSTSMDVNQGSSATGAALSLANLDSMIDSMKLGCDCLIMNRNMRRRLSGVVRAAPIGTYGTPTVPSNQLSIGQFIEVYGKTPIIVTDFITQTETISSSTYSAKTGGATTTIFGVKFGTPDGVRGLLGGGATKFKVDVFNLDNKNSIRIRLTGYPAVAIGSTLSVACVNGITDVAVVV